MGNTFVNYHKNRSTNEDQGQVMTSIIDKFLTFLKTSPSPFHAVDNVLKELTAVGYVRLRENDPRWAIKRGGKYLLTRNGSSLIAFVVGEQFVIIFSLYC